MTKKEPPKTCRTDVSFKKARTSKKYQELVPKMPKKKNPQELEAINKYLKISNHLVLNPKDVGHPQRISKATGVPITSVNNYFRERPSFTGGELQTESDFQAMTKSDIMGKVLEKDANVLIKALDQIEQSIDNKELSAPQLAEIAKLSANRYMAFSQMREKKENPVSQLSPQTVVVLAQFIQENKL